jgi:hypothetical protein
VLNLRCEQSINSYHMLTHGPFSILHGPQ